MNRTTGWPAALAVQAFDGAGIALRAMAIGAVCLGLCTCPARAQTGSGLSISGEMNVTYTRLSSLGQSRSGWSDDGSQWTLRSREVIDGDTVIGIKLQSGLDATSGAGGRFGRESLIWLQRGQVKLFIGRVLTVYDDVSMMWYEPVGGAQNPNALWANCAGSGGAADGCLDTFMNGSVRFDHRLSSAWEWSASLSAPEGLSATLGRPLAVSYGVRYSAAEMEVALASQNNSRYRYVGSLDRGWTVSVASNRPDGLRWAWAAEAITYAPEAAQQRYVGVLLSATVGPWAPWMNLGVARARNPSSTRVGALAPGRGRHWSTTGMLTLGIRRVLSPTTSLNAHCSVIDDQGTNLHTFSSLDTLPARSAQTHRACSWGLQRRF